MYVISDQSLLFNTIVLNDICICVIDFDEPPTDKEIVRMHKSIAYMWKNIGVALDLKAHKLKAIEKDNPNSCENACLEMLLTWKELNFNVSRRVLHQAIVDCEQEVKRKGMHNL